MSCPRCGYENPPNTPFCARCNCKLTTDVAGYNPNEQMKVILPPVIKPIEAVSLHAAPPANDEPLETVIITKPAIPPAAPVVAPPPVAPPPVAPRAEPPLPSTNGPSMAPVLPANAKQPAPFSPAPAADAMQTLVLGAEALAAISEPTGTPTRKPETAATEPLRTVVLEPQALAAITKPAAVPPTKVDTPAPVAPPAPAAPAPKPAAKAAAKPEGEPELAKQATNFSIAIGTASVVLLIVAISYYVLELRGDKAPEATLPPVAISAPAPAVVASAPPEPPPAVSEPTAPIAVQSVPEPEPVAVQTTEAPPPPPPVTNEIKASPAKAEPAVAATQPAGPRMLSNQEVSALLKELKKHSVPRDCAAASQMLVSEYAVLAKQAGRIAKQAYPDLCAPAPKPVVEPTPATRTTTQPARSNSAADSPAPPSPKAKTLDELYAERIDAECSKGAFGHICRETIRLKMCSGKLSDNPPAGQTACKQ